MCIRDRCVNNTRRELSRNYSHETQQERMLETHRRAEATWSKHLKSVCRRLNRVAGNTVISRADHYRERVEQVSALEQVTLSEVKYGPRGWKLGLRNEGGAGDIRDLYLKVGKASDGPYYCIIDNPKRIKEIVRSPKLLKGTYKTFMDGSSSKEKMRREGKRVRELMPLRGFEELQVVGANVTRVEYEGFKKCGYPKILKVESTIESEII
eukprot:TRINITY_DN8476_c0_g3_i2.p2 TRINITY_DN8476_c0_g3~~TRINITY_DN8476_c0_g3_i2.p2  ORF type:complete len:210 (+),score=57.06 TRINITY_DN8476_c0_g3_i2:80-709(+)